MSRYLVPLKWGSGIETFRLPCDFRRSFLPVFLAVLFLAGCSSESELRNRNLEQAATIQSLTHEIRRLNAELDARMPSPPDSADSQKNISSPSMGED